MRFLSETESSALKEGNSRTPSQLRAEFANSVPRHFDIDLPFV
jgi:hypothetical protein